MANWLDDFHNVVTKNRNAFAMGGAGGSGGDIGAMGAGFTRGMAIDEQQALAAAERQKQEDVLARQNAAREAMLGENSPAWMQGLSDTDKEFLGANPKVLDQLNVSQLMKTINPPAPAKRQMMKDVSGRQRYVDTGGFVFDDTADYVDPKIAANQQKTDLEMSKFAGSLRKEFTAESKDFKKISQSYQTIQKSANRKSGAGDMSLVFAFMKMLDPTSVVREGEFASAKDTAGVPSAIRNQYNKIINGEFLTPEQRQEFVSMAGDIYGGQKSKFDERADFYTSEAEAAGINPSRIIQDFSKGIDNFEGIGTIKPLKVGQTTNLGNGISIKKVSN